MKILYVVQATGNGHISRAIEILPYLKNYGEVDIFLSGANSTLELTEPVKYRSKGLSLFYTCKGGLNYPRIIRQLSISRIRKEIRDLPVENYDLVLNDFDCITSLACSRKKIPSVNFGHQASFISSQTPRPQKISNAGEWILKNYARGTQHVGLHFKAYDHFILSPVIKKNILKAEAEEGEHITVYLPSYCQAELLRFFEPLKDFRFQIFCWEVQKPQQYGHISFLPVSNNGFNESMIQCKAIICGAGFETPAEALHLQKKLMVMPIRGQYEQACNAAALQQLGVRSFRQLDEDFTTLFTHWIDEPNSVKMKFEHSTEEIVAYAINQGKHHTEMNRTEFPEFASL